MIATMATTFPRAQLSTETNGLSIEKRIFIRTARFSIQVAFWKISTLHTRSHFLQTPISSVSLLLGSGVAYALDSRQLSALCIFKLLFWGGHATSRRKLTLLGTRLKCPCMIIRKVPMSCQTNSNLI